MRRKEREITEPEQLVNLLEECKVCRIAMQDEKGLYIVPMNYGYEYRDEKLFLYVHSAKEGRKVSVFSKNPEIAFELDCGHRLIEGETACRHSYAYRSITGTGIIRLLGEPEKKKAALSLLMKHQTGKDFVFDDVMANSVLVYQIEVTGFTGKQRS